jgi:hypothetical protein
MAGVTVRGRTRVARNGHVGGRELRRQMIWIPYRSSVGAVAGVCGPSGRDYSSAYGEPAVLRCPRKPPEELEIT